jgi:hypothetical protein
MEARPAMTVSAPALVHYRLTPWVGGALREAAQACEEEVFLRTYGNTRELLAAEYGPYEASSHFLALQDDADEVVGVCRVIRAGPAGLKTVNDVAKPPWCLDGPAAMAAAGADLASTWDIATMAVDPDRAQPWLASAALYHGLALAMRANSVRWMTMLLDARARRLLAMVGITPEPMAGARPGPYLGSPSTVPLLGEIPVMRDQQRRRNPEGFRLISQGVGLNDVEVPPPDDFVLPAGPVTPDPEIQLISRAVTLTPVARV